LGYVVSDQQNLVGFLFADPLYAGRLPPELGNDKVLWVVRYPRNGHPLELTISRAGPAQRRHWEVPADSSPGEIYPSGVHAPSPGCWHVVAEWGSHRATLALPFVAAD
jgi:hypothetical protein